LAKNRGKFQDEIFALTDPSANDGSLADREHRKRFLAAKELKSTLDLAQYNYQQGKYRQNQVGKLGVNLAISTNGLKSQSRLEPTAIRRVANRSCMEFGGVWIDEAFTAKTPTLAIKAQSDAYFRILQRQPQMKEVFGLGNHVLWIAPNGVALVVDAAAGKDQLSDREIDALFAQ